MRKTALLLLALLVLSLPVLAEDTPLWTEDYYRAVSTEGEISDEEQVRLDEDCIAFMQEYALDLSLTAVTSDYLEGMGPEEYARYYFADCGFGYGPGGDGIQVLWISDWSEAYLVALGGAGARIPQDYLDYVASMIPLLESEHGVYGILYGAKVYLENYLTDGAAAVSGLDEELDRYEEGEEAPEAEETPAGPDLSDPAARVGEGADMPAWYPVHPKEFPLYHDENAPRVVDTADLFTAEEEQAMEARLTEIRGELEKDIVVFTDVSTYGLERKIYAADFYDFNGYGCGEDREGVVLFICMDPADRGWWTCCTGPITMGLYTEEIANQVDDLLYEYMVDGAYTDGVRDWIENFRRLYLTGSPYTPEWALTEPDPAAADPDAPRVVDGANLLSEAEIQSLTEQAETLSEQYGVDLAVHTIPSAGLLSREEYARRFFLHQGYGLGQNRDGLLLVIYKRPNYVPEAVLYGSGAAAEKLTDTNQVRMLSRLDDPLEDHEYNKAISSWLNQAGWMLRTGRAPRSVVSWLVNVLLALLAGLTFGGISLMVARGRMATPKVKENADQYLVKDSLRVEAVSDTFTHSTTSRKYSPQETRSSSDSGGSSGGSSYSSSYSGSSGSTHSGSGRDF